METQRGKTATKLTEGSAGEDGKIAAHRSTRRLEGIGGLQDFVGKQ